MNRSTKAGGTAVAVIALTLTLSACGSNSSTQASSSSSASTTSASSSSSSASSSTSPAPASAAPAGANETIADYITQNGITQTPVKRGDPGTPTVDLPVPAGWEDAGTKSPDYAFGAIIFTGDPAAATDPPSIIAIMSKLSGNVDPAKIFEYAPGELKNLPGFEGSNGETDKLGTYDAFQIGGTYVREGGTRLVAQKTVLIPRGGDLFVLQLNANGPESQAGPLMTATADIDEKTVITP